MTGMAGISNNRGVERQLWIDVPYIPLGQYQQRMAWRRTVIDIPVGFPLFYGMRPV